MNGEEGEDAGGFYLVKGQGGRGHAPPPDSMAADIEEAGCPLFGRF